jgi:UPF0716 protein FxsA
LGVAPSQRSCLAEGNGFEDDEIQGGQALDRKNSPGRAVKEVMFAKLFLVFVLVPLADLVLLWILFVSLPWSASLLLILVTALLGAYFSRQQGSRVLREIRQEIHRNVIPANSLLDGVLVFVAGVLLITPGILTDLVGFCLLFPTVRRYLRARLLHYLKGKIQVEAATFTAGFGASGFGGGHRSVGPHFDDDGVIEGEVVERHEAKP